MNIDIKQLVHDALIDQGCDESMLDGFDGHSTIALEFDGRPDLLISELDGGVWLWSHIAEDNQAVLSQRGGDLLFALMEGCGFTVCGQLQLVSKDGDILLRGLVNEDHLQNSQQFSSALEEFFTLQENFLGIIL